MKSILIKNKSNNKDWDMNLFTIGYEGHTITSFMERLLKSRVAIVVDVRLNPISRKQYFSKKALTEILLDKGIQYIHLKELGTPKELRNELANTKDYETFRRKYRKCLEKNAYSLDQLNELIKVNTVALMCFEADHNKCHRSVIATAMKENNEDEVQIKML